MASLHVSRFTLFASLCLMALGLSAASVRASETSTDVTGRWVLAEPHERVKARIERAIEEVVDDMNFLIRSTARSRLREKNGVPRMVVTARENGTTHVKFGTRRPFITEGRAWTSLTWGGQQMKVRATSSRPESLRLEIRNEDGTRINEFVVAENGTMTLRVRVSAEQLPKDLTYIIRYRRAS